MPFNLPPVQTTASNQVRKIGFELEFTGVGLDRIAEILIDLFGGTHVKESNFLYRVTDTEYGDFTVEIDAVVLKDKAYESYLEAVGIRTDQASVLTAIEEALDRIASTVVPYEIAMPPIPMTDLDAVEKLRLVLHENQAQGTGASFLYAFGLHMNPEIPSQDVRTVLRYLRAFLLLYDWVRKASRVDLSRRITPFINPFPDDYVRLVLGSDYDPDMQRLIEDYLQHNPTRYRALDLLPLFACIDEDLVLSRLPEDEKISSRPAFHYRLPNCLIGEADWSVAQEWNYWVEIEKLAGDSERIAEMSSAYLDLTASSWQLGQAKWLEAVVAWLE